MTIKSISLKAAAKKFGLGHLTLFKLLRTQRVLHDKGSLKNTPHPAYVQQGLFETIQVDYTTGPVRHRYIKTLVTPAGMNFIAGLITPTIKEQHPPADVQPGGSGGAHTATGPQATAGHPFNNRR